MTPASRSANSPGHEHGETSGRHDGASPRIHAVQGCLYPGCQRGGTVQHLCPQHHHEVTKGSESPLALTEGRWERGVGGVRRWVA